MTSERVHANDHSRTRTRVSRVLLVDGRAAATRPAVGADRRARWRPRTPAPAPSHRSRAQSTTLEDAGADLSSALWSSQLLSTADGRERISTAHRAFVDAGCDVIQTATCVVEPEAELTAQLSIQRGRLCARILGTAATDDVLGGLART